MEKRLLITRWLGTETQATPIYDEASVSTARQRVREIGRSLNLRKELVESVVLIASELTHNQLSHTKQGYCAVKAIKRDDVKGIEVLAADIGPGIKNPSRAIGGQTATHGGLGAGLGAVWRMADEVEFENRIFEGTRIAARKFETQAASRSEMAIMGHPYPGEWISGDEAVFLRQESGFLAAVIDGLGHGPEAREASNRAVEVLSARTDQTLEHLVADLDSALSETRGCAISVVRFDRTQHRMESVSLGDVYSHLYHLKDAHFFTSTPLILGTGQFRKQSIRVETKSVEPGSILVMFTDGLNTKATLKGLLDVLRLPAIAIAEHLIEKESRPDDDALVLVARLPR